MTIRYDPASDKRKLERLGRQVINQTKQKPAYKTRNGVRPTNPALRSLIKSGALDRYQNKQRTVVSTPSLITGKPASSGRSAAVAARSALRSTILKTGK